MSLMSLAARTVVIIGARPGSSAPEALADVQPGGEAAVFVLGVEPTLGQRRLVEEALAVAAERHFLLTAELVTAPAALRERSREGDAVRWIAGSRERRRWRLEAGPTARGAR